MAEGVACEAHAAAEIGVPERKLAVLDDRDPRDLEQTLLVVPVPEAPLVEVQPDPPQEDDVQQQEGQSPSDRTAQESQGGVTREFRAAGGVDAAFIAGRSDVP